MTPEVSIVLATHNGYRFIDESIQSVISQTFGNFELIIVDDASTDATPSKIIKWSDRERRIRVVTLPTNQRLPQALNEGFRHARGEFFTWTSDDNMYRPGAIAEMVDVLHQRPDLDVVYAGYSFINDQGQVIGLVGALPPSALAYGNCINGCFLYRRQVHERLGGYREEHLLVEDWDFWLRAAPFYTLQPIQKDLYLYRRHENSLTAQKGVLVQNAIANLLAQSLPNATWLDKGSLARGYKRIADARLRCSNYRDVCHYLMKACMVSPFTIGGDIVSQFKAYLGPRLNLTFVRQLKQIFTRKSSRTGTVDA